MTISYEALKAEELRLRYTDLLKDATIYPTIANWDYIILNKMEGIGDLLYAKYKSSLSLDEADRHDLHIAALEKFPAYLKAVSCEYASDVVYSHISDGDIALNLIRDCNLFSAAHIIDCIEQTHDLRVLDIIDVYRKEYTNNDYRAMCDLDSLLHSLPKRGFIEDVRGLFGYSSKYICPNGHSNDAGVKYCSHAGCGLDIFGITKSQSEAIGRFRSRIIALENLL